MAWPALQLTFDEELLGHIVNNTVNIYKTRAFVEGTTTPASVVLERVWTGDINTLGAVAYCLSELCCQSRRSLPFCIPL